MNEVEEIKIENLIYEIRGKQVMLDSDLAKLYGCKNGTKEVNQAVKRNIDRFPNDFYFQLTNNEFNQIKNKFSYLSYEERKIVLEAIRYVDEVITYTDVDEIVKEVDFDVFVTGPDQCHAGFQKAIQWCEDHKKEHIVLGRTDGVSSSELKAKIAAKTTKVI